MTGHEYKVEFRYGTPRPRAAFVAVCRCGWESSDFIYSKSAHGSHKSHVGCVRRGEVASKEKK